jgi:photosystem II stability/assembly factor-like uncharacterized protein
MTRKTVSAARPRVSLGFAWILLALYGPAAGAAERGEAPELRYEPDNLFGVSFVDDQQGWVSGYYGTILQTNTGGVHWVRRPMRENDLVRRIRFLGDRSGWAVTNRGRILATSDGGTTWRKMHEVPGIYLRDLTMLNRERGWEVGWAVGHDKTVLHTTDGGKSWQTQTIAQQSQDPPRLNGIAAYDADNAVLVGEFGTIAKTHDGGEHWSVIPSPLNTTFTAVAVSADHAIAVGIGGAMVRIPKQDQPVTVIATPTPQAMFDVALSPDGNGVAVGAGVAYRITGSGIGRVAFDVPGGPDLIWLGGVTLLPDGAAVAVGVHGVILKLEPGADRFGPLPDWTVRQVASAARTETLQ